MSSNFSVVFPGQGSQAVGMLAALAEAFPAVQQTFEEASAAVGTDLWALTREGPAEQLNQTVHTQPAMLASGVAVWRIWQAQGDPQPLAMAGHSLGEYTALVCAGALEFSDAASLVAQRGRLMQAAVPEGSGAMAAVLGLDDDEVRKVCAATAEGAVVQAVNFNAPGQVVIAGDAAAVERAGAMARDAGAKRVVSLPVSVPSHCSLMRDAASELAGHLAGIEIRPPVIPVIHNVSVTSESDPDAIRRALVDQLYSPVRWVETIRTMAERGASVIVEAGPGKVLAGLVKRIDRQLAGIPFFAPEDLSKVTEAIHG
ncbi:MAG: ACP S-malonyltransferase [Pseudomonadota bacterium]